MSLSPHLHRTDLESSPPQPPGGDTHADAVARRPWYRQDRYGLLAIAIAVIVAVVAVLFVEHSDTAPRGSGTGAAQPNPYDEAFGNFEPITRTGTGSGTIPMPAGDSTAGIITAQYSGPGSLDLGFQLETTYLSLIWPPPGGGPYSGSVAYGPHTFHLYGNHGEVPDSLSVSAGGPWEVTIAPISSAEELPTRASGVDAVFLYNGDGADLVVEHQHPRRLALSVSQWGLEPGPGGHFRLSGFEPLKTDRYSQTWRLAPGPSVVTIDSFDLWSARIE